MRLLRWIIIMRFYPDALRSFVTWIKNMLPKQKTHKSKEELKQRREVQLAFMIAVFGILSSIENIYLGCAILAVASYFLLQWIGHFHFLYSRPHIRYIANIVAPLVVLAVAWNPVVAKRHEQLAAKTSGHLITQKGHINDPINVAFFTKHKLTWTGPKDGSQFGFPQGAKFNVRRNEQGDLLVNTEVFDRSGKKVVEVVDNAWTVNPSASIPQVVSIDEALSDKLVDLLPIILKGGKRLLGRQIAVEALRLGYRRSDQAQVRSIMDNQERSNAEKELIRWASIGIGRHSTGAKGNAGHPVVTKEKDKRFRLATEQEVQDCLQRRSPRKKLPSAE